MSSVTQVLAEARRHIGYYRKPGTETTFGVWYALIVGQRVYRTAQWCAMFISYIASAAGASKIIPLHAYTPSGVNWWKAQKQWHNGLGGVRAGDIVYFRLPGMSRVSHVGLVESVNKDGSVNTIEGNTSSTAAGDQRNSGTCARKRRKAYIVGFGRPKYTATAAKPPAATKPKPKPTTQTSSIIEYLNSLKQDSSYKARTALAKKHGIVNYKGTAAQNTSLLAKLRAQPTKPPAAKPKPDVPGWFTVNTAVLNGRSGPSTKHKVKHKRARGFHLYIAKTVKGGGDTWAVTNYGTHYSLQYLKKGKH